MICFDKQSLLVLGNIIVPYELTGYKINSNAKYWEPIFQIMPVYWFRNSSLLNERLQAKFQNLVLITTNT